MHTLHGYKKNLSIRMYREQSINEQENVKNPIKHDVLNPVNHIEYRLFECTSNLKVMEYIPCSWYNYISQHYLYYKSRSTVLYFLIIVYNGIDINQYKFKFIFLDWIFCFIILLMFNNNFYPFVVLDCLPSVSLLVVVVIMV